MLLIICIFALAISFIVAFIVAFSKFAAYVGLFTFGGCLLMIVVFFVALFLLSGLAACTGMLIII